MGVNDRCAVGKCNNARKYPDTLYTKITSEYPSLQVILMVTPNYCGQVMTLLPREVESKV